MDKVEHSCFIIFTATTAADQDDTTSDESSDDVLASAVLFNTANSKLTCFLWMFLYFSLFLT